MKVATKTGDTGYSDIYQKRVKKSSLIIELLGEIDELVADLCYHASLYSLNNDQKIINTLSTIMSILSGYLPESSFDEVWLQELDDYISVKEEIMDSFSFVYPTENQEAASFNRLRTKVRKCERMLWRYSDECIVSDIILKYMNRLSDAFYISFLFVSDK